MRHWTIEDQENSVKASIIASGFLALLFGIYLLEEITLRWFGLAKISDAIGFSAVFITIFFIRAIWKFPKMMSYGWRLKEMKGEFQDEYLRSNFQRATTLAFQLMILIGFLCYIASNLVVNKGDPAWISYKLVTLLPVVAGLSSFYLSLRKVLDEQEGSVKDSQ